MRPADISINRQTETLKTSRAIPECWGLGKEARGNAEVFGSFQIPT